MLDSAFDRLGYRFAKLEILTEALTHASIADHRLQSNERMEFLGDAVLGYVISEYLFSRFPACDEGELTKIKSAVVSRKVCARISMELDLCTILNLGKGMSNRPGLPSSVAAAVLESLIAAIYLDGGIEPARAFILRIMTPHIDDMAICTHQQNYKSLLQQHAQQQMDANPSYILLDEKGPDHAKCFEVGVEINGRRYSPAWANSKKEAEQMAAANALRELGVLTAEPDSDVE